MELRFNINQAIETELYYGLYTIYILGGHHVKTNPDFFMQFSRISKHMPDWHQFLFMRFKFIFKCELVLQTALF